MEVGFKFKFEYSFIFAEDIDHAYVFALIWVFYDSVNITVWHAEISGLFRVFDTIWLEMQLVITQVELTNVFGLVHLSHFEAVLR